MIELLKLHPPEYTEIIEYVDVLSSSDSYKTTDKTLFKKILDKLYQAGARFCFLEYSYLDKDYSNDFSNFYSKRFTHGQKYCFRFSFFESVGFSISMWPPKRDEIEVLRNKCLGYCIVRPLEQGAVGRTLLSESVLLDKEAYCCTSIDETIHLMGLDLTIRGVPFIEQDKNVSVCATTALWMVISTVSNKLKKQSYSPSEITLAANKLITKGRQFPATDGLSVQQMVSGLTELGYNSLVYEKKKVPETQWNPKEFIYRYIESGLPAIIIVKTNEGRLHAAVIVGHDFDVETLIIPDFLESEGRLASNAAFIDHFIAHDDSKGPYLKVPVDYLYSIADDYTSESYKLSDVESVIVPVPDKLYMESSTVSLHIVGTLRDKSNEFIKFYEKHIESHPVSSKNAIRFCEETERVFTRAYAINSNELKKRFLKSTSAPVGLVGHYLNAVFPRYVWVVELYFESDIRKERKIFGEIILDGTGDDFTYSIISVHLPEYLICSKRNFPAVLDYSNGMEGFNAELLEEDLSQIQAISIVSIDDSNTGYHF